METKHITQSQMVECMTRNDDIASMLMTDGSDYSNQTMHLGRIEGNAGISAETLRAWNIKKTQDVEVRFKALENRAKTLQMAIDVAIGDLKDRISLLERALENLASMLISQ